MDDDRHYFVKYKDVKTWHISNIQTPSEAAKKDKKCGDNFYSQHGIPNKYFPTSNQTPYKFTSMLGLFILLFL